MRDKMRSSFPFKIRFYQTMVQICMGMFKPLYFKKYESILGYMEKDCASVLEKYRAVDCFLENLGSIPKIIWVLWWQGDGARPPVPDACIKRLSSLSGYEFNLVTKDNIGDYIFMDDILSYFDSGLISVQFLSDLIRMRLLRKYGGFWCDSTIAAINPDFFDDIVSNYKFYSIKLAGFPEWCSVSKGYFSSYFWASAENNPFFSYMDDCFTFFLKKHRRIIDYYQIDYTVMLGYRKISFVKDFIDSIPPSNPDIFWLSGMLDKGFDADIWAEKLKNNSLFKLSWRKRPSLLTRSGKKTFWAELLSLWGR